MNIEQYFKEYLLKIRNDKNYWNCKDSGILVSCQKLFEATHDTFYEKFIMDQMEMFLNEEDKILNKLNSIHTGKVLYFLYQQTQEERYYKAIESSMKQLRSLPRSRCGNFVSDYDNPDRITMDSLYRIQPFYMAYETLFNKKENYNDIIMQFRNVRQHIYDDMSKLYYQAFDEAKNQRVGCATLQSTGYFLMALIDTMAVMSIEIFEIYKEFERMFKDTIKDVLMYFDLKKKCFDQSLYRYEDENNYTETKDYALIAYAIMKACRLGVLSKEKYMRVTSDILANLFTDKFDLKIDTKDQKENCHDYDNVLYYLSKSDEANGNQFVNALMIAYAESLMVE